MKKPFNSRLILIIIGSLLSAALIGLLVFVIQRISSADHLVTSSSYVQPQANFFCKYCGSEIDSDSVFCKACGKKIK